MNKREFLRKLYLGTLGFGAVSATSGIITACGSSGDSGENNEGDTTSTSSSVSGSNSLFFDISLAQWSLHRTLRSGEMDNLDFAASARNDYGIGAVEYVNQFFKDKANDKEYLKEMNKRADDAGVKNVLIMIDGEGRLGATDSKERTKAVENHHRWVEAAKFLGCHSIRVNAAGQGTAEEVGQAAVDGLGQLSTFAKDHDINVIVENHGGYSSNGQWLSNVISQVNMNNCGTLPDFGNFCIRRGESGCAEEYDRYKGIKELLPYAKGVSAKSHDFNENGAEIHTDYNRVLQMVKDSGYRGYIGIEYEGRQLSEPEGIKATKALLERVGKNIS